MMRVVGISGKGQDLSWVTSKYDFRHLKGLEWRNHRAMWMAGFGLDSCWVGDSRRVFKFKSGLIWKALKMRQRYVHLMCLEMRETVGKIEEGWKPCSRKATWTLVILWWAGQLRGCVVRGDGQVLLNQKSLPVPPAVPASLPRFSFSCVSQ